LYLVSNAWKQFIFKSAVLTALDFGIHAKALLPVPEINKSKEHSSLHRYRIDYYYRRNILIIFDINISWKEGGKNEYKSEPKPDLVMLC